MAHQPAPPRTSAASTSGPKSCKPPRTARNSAGASRSNGLTRAVGLACHRPHEGVQAHGKQHAAERTALKHPAGNQEQSLLNSKQSRRGATAKVDAGRETQEVHRELHHQQDTEEPLVRQAGKSSSKVPAHDQRQIGNTERSSQLNTTAEFAVSVLQLQAPALTGSGTALQSILVTHWVRRPTNWH